MTDQPIVFGTYHLPQWAIDYINTDAGATSEQMEQLDDRLSELEILGPKITVLNNNPDEYPSGLFIGDAEETFEVMLTGHPTNTHKIKQFYATLGSEKFFEILHEGRERIKTKSFHGLTESGFFGDGEYPTGTDFQQLMQWVTFGSPYRQVWATITLEDNS